jgi:nitrogen fixation NifU-like protein
MGNLNELYQEVLLDHNRNPHNFRELTNATIKIDGYNPLCGDRITVWLMIEDKMVKDIGFQGSGCAISKASASLMTDVVKGKSFSDIEHLYQEVHDMLTGKAKEQHDLSRLGKLAVLSGVCEFPMRVKCATLAWHAVNSAIHGGGEKVSTE